MRIRIETNDEELASDMMNRPEKLVGSRIELPGGVIVVCERNEIRRGAISEILIELSMSLVAGVSSSLLATWLYENLRGRTARLRINRREVDMQEEGIENIIGEEREKET